MQSRREQCLAEDEWRGEERCVELRRVVLPTIVFGSVGSWDGLGEHTARGQDQNSADWQVRMGLIFAVSLVIQSVSHLKANSWRAWRKLRSTSLRSKRLSGVISGS
jgi:hypothetical protein